MRATLLEERKLSDVAGQFAVQFWAGAVPKVQLVSFTEHPAETIAYGMRGYLQNYTLDPMTEDEIDQMLKDAVKTKLATPLEFVNFVFLINDVPRTWTHQAVRTRVGAAFVQESSRVYTLNRKVYKILVPPSYYEPDNLEIRDSRTLDHLANCILKFRDDVLNGVAVEDARMHLPQSLLTSMFASYTLNTLARIYEQRWCCQAEPTSWLPVLIQIRKIVKEIDPRLLPILSSPFMRGQNCGFNASFDRPCHWRRRELKPETIDDRLEEL